jgi:hypothetical protein
VSVFTKERMARMGLLNAYEGLQGERVPLKCLSVTTMPGQSYRFFTNLSGLSQALLTKVCLFQGRLRSLNRLNRGERTGSFASSCGR